MSSYKDLIIPQLDVNDNKVTIEKIRYNNLDYVEEGDILYTVSTAKSVDDYMVDFSGYVVLFVKDGGDVEIGKSAGMIFKDRKDAEKKLSEITVTGVQSTDNVSAKALEYAREIGFDLSLIKKEGIIKLKDIEDYIKNNPK